MFSDCKYITPASANTKQQQHIMARITTMIIHSLEFLFPTSEFMSSSLDEKELMTSFFGH
jgi:hypothetical protein